MRKLVRLVAVVLASSCTAPPPDSGPLSPHQVTYPGGSGPGEGRTVVLISGDHEYRSEELLPALGRILAHRYGFTAHVFFTLDSAGFIEPGSSNISGLAALADADVMVIATRFQEFPEAEMAHLVEYLDRAGPVVGIRTATHAFRIDSGPYARYSWDYEGDDYLQGFGQQVLGETWVGHYGRNHVQSSLVVPEPGQLDHVILRGATNMHAQSGGYQAYPPDDATVIARGRVLNGMDPDAEPDVTKEELPVAWTRHYRGADGATGRVFTSTHGASEDILNEGFRRMLINGILWAGGLEDAIAADNNVDLVGPYHPVVYSFDGYRRGVRPSDMAGFDTPIMPPDRPTTADSAGEALSNNE